MTRHRLLEEADSAELTMWHLFLRADAEFTKARTERDKKNRELVGDS